MKILDVLTYLLPNGTEPIARSDKEAVHSRRQVRPTWTGCPVWPVDVFAVAAVILEKTDAYARIGVNPSGQFARICSDDYLRDVELAAKAWRAAIGKAQDLKISEIVPTEVSAYWTMLWKHRLARLADVEDHAEIIQALIALLAISDQACDGVGWPSNGTQGSERHSNPIAFTIFFDLLSSAEAMRTACVLIPEDRVVVLPKSLTPAVGCTVRSMSHNLALLPPSTVLASNWRVNSETGFDDSEGPNEDVESLNYLLIPYPFEIDGHAFVDVGSIVNSNRADRAFRLEQTWLIKDSRPITGRELYSDVVEPLLREAGREVKRVNAIVFPECSLNEAIADALALELRQYESEIEYLICGASASGRRNVALTYHLKGKSGSNFRQSKHHRWFLDRRQVMRYHIGDSLSLMDGRWWEDIDVSERSVAFYAHRRNACFCVLICEDLARHDPMMPAIKAVGPTLLIALLMDGPQIKLRWPNQYAAVLADDPGTAVLTLTSLGMVRRSSRGNSASASVIALWKHPGDDSVELSIPNDSHGMVATLSPHFEDQVTLDGRRDGESTVRYRLTSWKALKVSL